MAEKHKNANQSLKTAFLLINCSFCEKYIKLGVIMGFFQRLANGLKNTKKSFSEKLKYVFTGNEIDEDFLKN